MTARALGILPSFLLLSLFSCGAPSGGGPSGKEAPPPPSPIAEARQLLVVTADSWGDHLGVLRRFQRTAGGGAWEAAGKPFQVELGRSGMGWGRGLHGGALDQGPVKKEGDGRSPAGAFRLTEAFGYAPADQAGFVKLKYRAVTPGMICVDDPRSKSYGLLVDPSTASSRDWTSFERMSRPDDLYLWGIVVDHNRPNPVPGLGSCIFLHTWDGRMRGTSGCTAMPADRLLELLTWVDQVEHPVLVQLPKPEYILLQDKWGLPPIKP